MTKKWEISRGEAEYMVGILESVPKENQLTGMYFLGASTANVLAAELRKLFGMLPSDEYEQPTKIERWLACIAVIAILGILSIGWYFHA